MMTKSDSSAITTATLFKKMVILWKIVASLSMFPFQNEVSDQPANHLFGSGLLDELQISLAVIDRGCPIIDDRPGVAPHGVEIFAVNVLNRHAQLLVFLDGLIDEIIHELLLCLVTLLRSLLDDLLNICRQIVPGILVDGK